MRYTKIYVQPIRAFISNQDYQHYFDFEGSRYYVGLVMKNFNILKMLKEKNVKILMDAYVYLGFKKLFTPIHYEIFRSY